MLSEFFKSRVRIQALRDGPAGSLLESFAQALSEAGYVRRIARRYLRAAEHFIYWTDRHGVPLCKVNEQFFARFDRHLSRCRCPHYGHTDQWTVGRGARMFLTYLPDTSIITPPSSVKPTIHDPALLSAFCQWMRQQRGTCDVTLYTYSIYIRELLRRLGEQPNRFDARQLRAFILEKSRYLRAANSQKLRQGTSRVPAFLDRQGAMRKNASIQVCGKQIRSLVEEISLNRPGPHIKGLHSFTHAARTKLSDADRGTTAAPSSSATGGLAKIKSASRWRVYLARGSPS